jgi:oligopeptidase B
MKNIIFFVFLFLVQPLLLGQNADNAVPEIAHADTLHGVVIPDPYHWMEDIHSPEVLNFVKAENKKTKASIKKFRRMAKEFIKREKQWQIISHPRRELFEKPDGDYIYYIRRKGMSLLYCRKRRDAPEKEELLLSEKEALAGEKGFEILQYKLSPSQEQIAYLAGHFDSEDARLYIKYQIHSKITDEELHNATYYEWMNDSTIVYVQYNRQTDKFNKLYMHRLGTPQSADRLIYEEQDKTMMMDVCFSASRKYLLIEISNAFTSETRYLDVDHVDDVDDFDKLKIISPREHGHHYRVYHDTGDSVFYIKTNLDAPNFRIVKTSVRHPESRNWVDVLPETNHYIESVQPAGNSLALSEYGDGCMKLSLLDKHTGEKHTTGIDEETTYNASVVYIDTLKKTIRLKYCSYITPDTYCDYDIQAKRLSKIFETQTKNYRKSDYVVDFMYVSAHDGAQIPVTIIYNKNTPLDGSAPVDMNVYGAYGDMSLPVFYPSLSAFAILDRGFVWVRTAVRGGGGYSSKSHRNGTVLQKKNTVLDVVSVARFLINKKYTSASKIHLTGRSEGGLSVGMAANMYPELWGSLVFFVPKLDVLFNTDKERDQSEWLEVGNPYIKEEFDYMLGWSPYQNIKKQAYPPMQFMTGLNDENVPPYETFKMVARLRANQTGSAPIYMSTDPKGNHYRLNYKYMLHPIIFKLAVHYNLL